MKKRFKKRYKLLMSSMIIIPIAVISNSCSFFSLKSSQKPSEENTPSESSAISTPDSEKPFNRPVESEINPDTSIESDKENKPSPSDDTKSIPIIKITNPEGSLNNNKKDQKKEAQKPPDATTEKKFVSNLDDKIISDIDEIPDNIVGSEKIFFNSVNNFIVKSNLPDIKQNFFNTTLHHINLKGGNNLLWKANNWKQHLTEERINRTAVNDPIFDNLFRNAVQFKNFKWEIRLNPKERESNDFLKSYLGTYFVLSYFSSFKTFNWFNNDVSKAEREATKRDKPKFLNSALFDYVIAQEYFEADLTMFYKILNYWYEKFWEPINSEDIMFSIEGISKGGNYFLSNKISKISKNINVFINENEQPIVEEAEIGDDIAQIGVLTGKFTVAKEKTSIQDYIDRYVQYKSQKGNRFLGVFPLIFRNPDTFDLERGLSVRFHTIFNWVYEKFILNDRPNVNPGSQTATINKVKRDVFEVQKNDKTSKKYIDFINLIIGEAKEIYKNSNSYLFEKDFNEENYSEVIFEFDWNANFLFVFVS